MHRLFIVIVLFATVLPAQDDEFFEPTTTVGGYGELHYNNTLEEGTATEKLDFHRFVLFIEHNWTPQWSFKSEVELEHNFVEGGESAGELALEQAYVEYRPTDHTGLRAGVILLNVGLTNPNHEPPLFFSVERPEYSAYIIPTTWYGNGAALTGRFKAFEYTFSLTEGLDGARFSAANGIRKGREHGYKADASTLLYSLNLTYYGFNGWMLGGSYTYNKARFDKNVFLPFSLTEFHFSYEQNNLLIRGEWGQIHYNGASSGFTVERARGYYIDAGYAIGALLDLQSALIPWLRLSTRDTADKLRTGINEHSYKYSTWLLGVDYKPLPDVVFKAELGRRKRASDGKTGDLFNLSVGYMF